MVCDDSIFSEIDAGLRDKWGRLTEKGFEKTTSDGERRPHCPPMLRKAAFAQEIRNHAEGATHITSRWMTRVNTGKWIFRIGGALAILAAIFGFLGFPNVLGGLLVAAGTLPLGTFLISSANFMLPPLAILIFLVTGIVVFVKA